MNSGNDLMSALADEDDYIEYMMNIATPRPDGEETTITNDPSTSNARPLQLSLTTEDKMNLKNILESWNMGFLYQTCVDQCVGVKVLYDINTYHIALLLKDYALGVKMKFERCIKQWRKDRGANQLSDVNEPSSAPSVPNT